MRLDEETYKYMKNASLQLECITCALATHLEVTISDVQKYDYRVFNELMNQVRNMQIDAIEQIEDVFSGVSLSIESMAQNMRISNESMSTLNAELQSFGECIGRLVIRCKSIFECQTSTENPYIPGIEDEIYSTFSKYKKIIDEYNIDSPNDDVVGNVIYSFFIESKKIYEQMYAEIDDMMKQTGEELYARQRSIAEKREKRASEIVDFVEDAKKVGKAAVGLGVAIVKKEKAPVVEKTVGFVAKLGDTYKDAIVKNSKLEKTFAAVDTYNKTMDIVDKTLSLSSMDGEVKSIIKLAGAAALCIKPFNLQALNKQGKLDLAAPIIATATSGVTCAVALASPVPLLAALYVPKFLKNSTGLLIKTGKYIKEKNIRTVPETADASLAEIAGEITTYEKKVKESKKDALLGRVVKKIKKPKLLSVHQGSGVASWVVDTTKKVWDGIDEDVKTSIITGVKKLID